MIWYYYKRRSFLRVAFNHSGLAMHYPWSAPMVRIHGSARCKYHMYKYWSVIE